MTAFEFLIDALKWNNTIIQFKINTYIILISILFFLSLIIKCILSVLIQDKSCLISTIAILFQIIVFS